MADKNNPLVEILPIERGATPDQQNVNKHTLRGRGLHENSMRRRGAGRSIFSAGKNVDVPVVIGGNQTLEIAATLGMDVVNVHTSGDQIVNVVRDDIAPGTPEFYALGIEDNEIGRASYNPDVEILAAIMADPTMQAAKAEDKMLADIVDGMGAEKEIADAGPEIGRADELQKKWMVKTGDLWQLGDHRLICGDCTNANVVEMLMRGDVPGCVVADPPYGINLDVDYFKSFGAGKKYKPIVGDECSFDASKVAGCAGVKEQFWFGADYYSRSLGDTEHCGSWLVWDKRVEESADKMYGSCFELCFSFNRHKRHIFRHLWASFFTGGEKREYLHPTTKPTSLICDILQLAGQAIIIYDPFSGSGTVIMACENLNRKCRAVEISPEYVAVALERWSVSTGKSPVKVG